MSAFDAVLRRYGKPAALYRNGQVHVATAIVQPILDKIFQWSPSPLGRISQDRFLYLGCPEMPLDGLNDIDFLEWDGQRFNVMTTHCVQLRGTTLYQWAVLTLRENLDLPTLPSPDTQMLPLTNIT